jgi:shikimate dehydrogenase
MSTATEHVYTLADLKNWPIEKAKFPPTGTALAVIGHPIAHSLSPAMHNAALRELARNNDKFRDWWYYKFEIHPDNLGEAIDLFYQKKFKGLNLTVPHKTDVLKLSNFQVEPQQLFLREMGAANTLVRNNARWSGYNTDGFGFKNALARDLGLQLENNHFILLGAGGAARAAAMMCVGISKSLWIGSRTKAKRDALIKQLKASMSYRHYENFLLKGFDLENPPSALPEGAIVINATSLGLKSADESPIDLPKIPKPSAVFDMIYRPAETALLRQAKSMEIASANGLSMLVLQGASSLEKWTELQLSDKIVELMHLTVRNALN